MMPSSSEEIDTEVYFKRVENLEADLRELLRSLQWEKIVNHNDKVLIKPNFCTHELRNGVTTNMELLNALVRVVKERSENVFVGETESWGKKFGKLKGKLALECEFLNLSEMETYDFAGKHSTYALPKIVRDCKIINVPVLKTHVLTGVTLGIKNLFGLIQGKEKGKYHFRIGRVLADLAVLQPAINILDATYSMDGNGPGDGNVHKTDFLLASRSVVALDLAACELIGVDAASIEHLRLASQRYGAEYRIMGDKFERLSFNLPKITMTTKFGALMQSNVVTRRILESEKVLPVARKLKRMLERN